jgi:hypothetical protein
MIDAADKMSGTGGWTWRRVLVINGIAVLALVIGMVLGRQLILDGVQKYRAGKLFAEAKELYEQELWEQASRRGSVAHQLDQENEAIMLLVARALLKERRADAVEWMRKALRSPDVEAEELQLLTRSLLASAQVEEAMDFLARLYEIDPEGLETQRLWLATLEAQRRTSGSYEVLAGLVQDGAEDWSLHERYLSLQRNRGSESWREDTEAHLLGLVRSNQTISRLAARELCGFVDASDAARLEAGRFLERVSEPGSLDQLIAMTVRVQLTGEGEAALLEAATQLLEDGEATGHEELLQWAVWAERLGWLLDRLDWSSYDSSGADEQMYLQALLLDNRHAEVLRITEALGQDGGRDASAVLFFRSQALIGQGLLEDAERVLRIAVQSVNPDNFAVFERLLMSEQRSDLLLELYELVEQARGINPQLRQRLIAMNYQAGNHARIVELIRDLELAEYLFRPEIFPFFGYLKLLTAGDLAATHSLLEEALLEYPEYYDHHVLVALSYQLLGQAGAAQRLAGAVETPGIGAPRFLRVAAVGLGMGASTDMLRPDEWEGLLPPELRLISEAESTR